jgi:hypothetical protein
MIDRIHKLKLEKQEEKAKTHKPKLYKNKIPKEDIDAQFSASELFQ